MPRVRLNKAEYTARAFSDKVRGELARQKVKRQKLADYLNMTPQNLGQKLLNHTEWTLKEMVEDCDFLYIGFHVGEKGD